MAVAMEGWTSRRSSSATTGWYFLHRRNSKVVCKITGHRHHTFRRSVRKDRLFRTSTLLWAKRTILTNLYWFSPTNCRCKLPQPACFKATSLAYRHKRLSLRSGSAQLGTEHAQCCQGGLILEIKCPSARKMEQKR